jgi:hypothetical protein
MAARLSALRTGRTSPHVSLFLKIHGTLLKRIFGPKVDEVTGNWRKLHKDGLHNLYSSTNIITLMKTRRKSWAGHVARMGETRNAYRILMGKPEGRRPLGRPRRGWVDNIKIDLRKIDWMVWSESVWFGIGTSGGLL